MRSRDMRGDPKEIAEKLNFVSYYRLTGYSFPFRGENDQFLPGTTFETVWRRYTFDRQLRLLLMDAIERIEIAFRTQLACHHSMTHGPFGYTEQASFPKLDEEGFQKFFSKIVSEIERSREKEQSIAHFFRKYGDEHAYPPFWMAVEVLTFGNIVSLYRNSSHKVKQAVASAFGMPDRILAAWILSLNFVRNICAYHSRLWNRELSIKPLIPKTKEWHTPVEIKNNRVFGILTICQYFLNIIAPDSNWANRFHQLLCDYPEIPTQDMGMPECWQESPIWKQKTREEQNSPRA